LKITVEGEPPNVVHKNLVLIQANSPQTAYQRAWALVRSSEISYENPAGKKVCIKFRGLSDLNVIHDELKDGTELLYEEMIGVSNEDIEKWVLSKEELSVFRPFEPTRGPDYSSREIVDEAQRLVPDPSQ
jgi:hypothetical protein